MLTEKHLSECWDTLEIIWCGVSSLPPIYGQEKQLDHINNTVSFVNGLLNDLPDNVVQMMWEYFEFTA